MNPLLTPYTCTIPMDSYRYLPSSHGSVRPDKPDNSSSIVALKWSEAWGWERVGIFFQGGQLGASKNRGGPPKSSILIGVFHYKLPSILGENPLFLETSN